ncbi:MAG TPA: archaellin/type IV pilin N-terminal domain-containing protein [Candidatus Thermoplasmatota archaeon]|nr:archaellin/type IV pilin N-terminal domain-containing protein [Candidatus Thermoplasmatota archaeon]
MKANRKFLKNDEEAVSPVIAVILMVAITVVLAATVYVWVSGFGNNSSAPAKSVALTSAGGITNDCNGDATTGDYCKSYLIASASPGLKYSDMSLQLDGVAISFDGDGCDAVLGASNEWGACAGTADRTGAAVVSAGETLKVGSTASLSGKTLRIVDPNSNSLIYSVVLQ